MRIVSWNKKCLGVLLVLIILVNTVSGYPTGPATTVLLAQRKASKRNQRSTVVGFLGSQSEVMRLGLGLLSKDDVNQPELQKSKIDQKSGEKNVRDKNASLNKEQGEDRGMILDTRVKMLIAKQLGVPILQVTLASRLVDDLGADSLDVVELVMAIEDEFEVQIPDEEVEKIITVRDAVNIIRSHQR